MSFFKRILGDESDLINELCDHLRQIGLNVNILNPESTEGKLLGGIGNVIIEGRNIELVQVSRHTTSHPGPRGQTRTHHYYLYHYGVRANVDYGLEDKLKTDAKPIRKSFFNRTIIDYKWEGAPHARELVELLNADSELKNILIKEGIDNLWTSPSKNLQYVWITRRGDRKEFPTQSAFEAYDRIMQHMRSILGSQR